MKKQIVVGAALVLLCCSKKAENSTEPKDTLPDTIKKVVRQPEVPTTENEVLLDKDILFNGKLPRYFSIQDFEKVFVVADSTKLVYDIEPCTTIFENPNGGKDTNHSYWYKNGAVFEQYKNEIAVERFKFIKNNYLLYKNNKIDATTTPSDLKKIFPNAVKNSEIMDVNGEGNLEVLILQEDATGISDGHIKLFFKDNHAYYIQWWFPC